MPNCQNIAENPLFLTDFLLSCAPGDDSHSHGQYPHCKWPIQELKVPEEDSEGCEDLAQQIHAFQL